MFFKTWVATLKRESLDTESRNTHLHGLFVGIGQLRVLPRGGVNVGLEKSGSFDTALFLLQMAIHVCQNPV